MLPRVRATVALWVIALLVATGCRPPAVRAPTKLPAEAPSFEAERIDVAADWEKTPSVPRDKPPIALTASDGSGLRLASLEARVVVHGPLAFTELHLAFDNDESRVREGTFTLQLPAGAAVSRFAMKIQGGWQEGEVVERQAARAAYETVLRRKVDPAMLEHDAGNVFRGRVFPIFARQRKELIVSYSHEIARSTDPYRLGLHGLPTMEKLDVQLLVPAQKTAFVLQKTNIAPDRDFVWVAKNASDAVRGGRWIVVRPPPPPATRPVKVDDLAVVIDSSASRASEYRATTEKLRRVIERIHPKSVKVACFDQEVAPMPTLAAAAERRPAGASNLNAALQWLAASGAKRGIVVTDGLATIGPDPVPMKIDRLDIVAVGSAQKTEHLRALSAATVLVDGNASEETIAHDLEHAPRTTVTATVPGAIRSWTHDSLVFAELAAGAAGPAAEEAPAALVERAVVGARIRDLARRPDTRAEIVGLSTKHRVLSDHTAMLVLETEADYESFHIPRNDLADILIVGPHGVVTAKRGDWLVLRTGNGASPIIDPRPVDPNQDSDRDGIPDIVDKCPLEPENYNGFQDEDGCPDKGHVIIDSDNIIVLNQVHFRDGAAEILPESSEIIEAVAQVMLHHPEFALVEIAGHTDERGDAAANMAMSRLRAEAVMKALLARSVPKERLRARGYGPHCPLDPAHEPEAQAKNRRVEFKIVATRDGLTGVELGCENAFRHGVPRPQETRPQVTRGPSRPERQNGKLLPFGDALAGPFAEVSALVHAKKNEEALRAARAWTDRSPDDPLAWIAEGRALTALGRTSEAERAFGSLLDLATKPEHRRAAAAFLETLKSPSARELAIDLYRRAVQDRPDHASAHHLLAHALGRAGRFEEGLAVIRTALGRTYDRVPRAAEILKLDAAILSGSTDKNAVYAFLTWETDDSDLDLLIEDGAGGYLKTTNDVQLGYGPEALVLDKVPAKLQVHQVRRGPQGFAVGKVAIVRGRSWEDRPFVIMNDGAAIEP